MASQTKVMPLAKAGNDKPQGCLLVFFFFRSDSESGLLSEVHDPPVFLRNQVLAKKLL